jgi:hypothetical protein
MNLPNSNFNSNIELSLFQCQLKEEHQNLLLNILILEETFELKL